jgi:hypothetical protein
MLRLLRVEHLKLTKMAQLATHLQIRHQNTHNSYTKTATSRVPGEAGFEPRACVNDVCVGEAVKSEGPSRHFAEQLQGALEGAVVSTDRDELGDNSKRDAAG